MEHSTIRFRKIFGYCLVAILTLYVLISLYLLFVPRAAFINNKLTQYYNWFALPGPYFRDDRIRIVPHFTIAYKSAGSDWSVPRNVALENFQSYHDNFAYAALKRSRYERFMAKALSRAANGKAPADLQKKKAFKEFHHYLKSHYLPGDTDSVRMVYQFQTFDGNETDSLATVFQYEYKSF